MSKKLPDNINYNAKNMFHYAFLGIKTAIKEERNLKIDLWMAIAVIICGFVFKVTKIEWLFLLFAISNVVIAEMVNTIIENIVDWICSEYHQMAKKIKDYYYSL